jgi:hypothetical protein
VPAKKSATISGELVGGWSLRRVVHGVSGTLDQRQPDRHPSSLELPRERSRVPRADGLVIGAVQDEEWRDALRASPRFGAGGRLVDVHRQPGVVHGAVGDRDRLPAPAARRHRATGAGDAGEPSVAKATPPKVRSAAGSSGGMLASTTRIRRRTRGQRSVSQPSSNAAIASSTAQRKSVTPRAVSSGSHGLGPGSPVVWASTHAARIARLTSKARVSRRVDASSSEIARVTWAVPAAAKPMP